MRAYLPVQGQNGQRRQWIVVSVDQSRRCEALTVFDGLEDCLAEVARLNEVSLQEVAGSVSTP